MSRGAVPPELHWQDEAVLDALNTLRLPSRARALARAGSVAAVEAALARADELGWPVHVLGQGSNLVLAPRIEGLVLQPTLAALHGQPDATGIEVEIEAGRDWNAVVRELAGAGFWGIENLALIPGTVGAAPVQNIGAYGQELAECCTGVRVLDRRDGRILELDAPACGFGYRDSRFRRERGRWLILSVRMRLLRRGQPRIDYPGVAEALAEPAPTALQVADAVSAVRRARLPDPVREPNAGSFFKNPVLDAAVVQALRVDWPDLPAHPTAPDGQGRTFKVPAAWLIERCGWRGRRRGGVGVSATHALVLTHAGGSDGHDLLALAAEIVESVRERFAVVLEQEPVAIGFD